MCVCVCLCMCACVCVCVHVCVCVCVCVCVFVYMWVCVCSDALSPCASACECDCPCASITGWYTNFCNYEKLIYMYRCILTLLMPIAHGGAEAINDPSPSHSVLGCSGHFGPVGPMIALYRMMFNIQYYWQAFIKRKNYPNICCYVKLTIAKNEGCMRETCSPHMH